MDSRKEYRELQIPERARGGADLPNEASVKVPGPMYTKSDLRTRLDNVIADAEFEMMRQSMLGCEDNKEFLRFDVPVIQAIAGSVRQSVGCVLDDVLEPESLDLDQLIADVGDEHTTMLGGKLEEPGPMYNVRELLTREECVQGYVELVDTFLGCVATNIGS